MRGLRTVIVCNSSVCLSDVNRKHSQPVSIPALQVVLLALRQQPSLATVPVAYSRLCVHEDRQTNSPVVLCFSFQLFTEYGRLAMEETFLKPFQVSPRVLASIRPLCQRWLGPELIGFTTRCHCSLQDGEEMGMPGDWLSSEKERLCASLPLKRLPDTSNIALSFLSEPLPSRELCPLLPDVLPGLESSQVLQQVCHTVFSGTWPSLHSERFEPSCPGNPCSWQNERMRISSELSQVTAELWEGSV